MPVTATDQMRLRNRIFIVGAALTAAIAFGVIAASGVSKNLVYYWTPTDLRNAGQTAYGATIRLGGMVAPGSIQRKGTSGVEFDVKDAAQIVHVKASGVPPQMFRDNIGVVVEGTMKQGDYFESTRLMVSHNNEYRPPAAGHPVDEKELKKLMETAKEMSE